MADAIPNVLLGKPAALDYQTQTSQTALQRKRALVNAMMASALRDYPGTTQAGNVTVANWGDAIAKMLEMLAAKRDAGTLSAEEEQVAREVKARLAQATDQFQAVSADRVVTPEGPPRETGPDEVVKGDRVRALLNALKSGDPTWQKIGAEGLEAQVKGYVTDSDRAKLTPNIVPGSMGPGVDPSQYRPTPKQGLSDGVAYTAALDNNGNPLPIQTQVVNRYEDPTKATPTMPAMQKQTGTGEVKALGTGSLASPETAGGRTIAIEAAKALVKQVSEDYPKVRDAANRVQYIVDLLPDLDKIVAGSPLSNIQLGAMKAFHVFGFYPDKEGRIPASETVLPVMAKQAADLLKDLRPASNVDLQLSLRNIAADPNVDPRTAKRVLEMAVKTITMEVQNHQNNLQALQSYDDIPGMEGMGTRLAKQFNVPFKFTTPPDVNIDNEQTGLRNLPPIPGQPRRDPDRQRKLEDAVRRNLNFHPDAYNHR